jgi:hypothetical protein
MGQSGVFVEGHSAGRLGVSFQQGFDAPDGFGHQQDIATHRADLSRDVVNDDYLSTVTHSVHDIALFILARTALDSAFHLECLL